MRARAWSYSSRRTTRPIAWPCAVRVPPRKIERHAVDGDRWHVDGDSDLGEELIGARTDPARAKFVAGVALFLEDHHAASARRIGVAQEQRGREAGGATADDHDVGYAVPRPPGDRQLSATTTRLRPSCLAR